MRSEAPGPELVEGLSETTGADCHGTAGGANSFLGKGATVRRCKGFLTYSRDHA